MPLDLIHALALVKKAAALINQELDNLDSTKADAIVAAADEILDGRHPDDFQLAGLANGQRHADQHEHERGPGQ